MKTVKEQLANDKNLFESMITKGKGSVDPNYGYAEQDTDYWKSVIKDLDPKIETVYDYAKTITPRKSLINDVKRDLLGFTGKKPKYFSILRHGHPKSELSFGEAMHILDINSDLPGYEGDHYYGSNGLGVEQLFSQGSLPLVDGSVIYATNK